MKKKAINFAIIRYIAQRLFSYLCYLRSLSKQLFYYVFCNGWIERKAGRAVRRYLQKDSFFLDVGCGNHFKMAKYLIKKKTYFAFDLKLSPKLPFIRKTYNVFCASASNIPLFSNVVDVLTCVEVLYEVNHYRAVLDEIYRVCKSDAIVIITIYNAYCYKYEKKGSHPKAINSWKYEEFIEIMQNRGFKLIEGGMQGWWIPILKNRTTSLMIPYESHDEFKNCNFFYVFRCKK